MHVRFLRSLVLAAAPCFVAHSRVDLSAEIGQTVELNDPMTRTNHRSHARCRSAGSKQRFPRRGLCQSDCRKARVAPAASYLQRHGNLHAKPTSNPEEATPQAPVTLVVQQIAPSENSRLLEIFTGVVIGMAVTCIAVAAGCWPSALRKQEVAEPTQVNRPAKEPDVAVYGLSAGQLQLPYICYNEAYFRQFSWSTCGERDSVTVLDTTRREVARFGGRLMAAPNGEILAENQGATWAVLKRPAPSRRPGRLWDFKICTSDGAPYADVRQMSETKCVVHDVALQRKVMTVVGNFTYPVFLSGERNIHVWFQQDAQCVQPGLGAQVEATLENEVEQGEESLHTLGGSMPSSSADPPKAMEPIKGIDKEASEKVASSHRFHVTTTANLDASLVLAVLVGLHDVHRAAARQLETKPGAADEQSYVRWPAPEVIDDDLAGACKGAAASIGAFTNSSSSSALTNDSKRADEPSSTV